MGSKNRQYDFHHKLKLRPIYCEGTGDTVIFEDIYYTYFGDLELRVDGISIKLE